MVPINRRDNTNDQCHDSYEYRTVAHQHLHDQVLHCYYVTHATTLVKDNEVTARMNMDVQ